MIKRFLYLGYYLKELDRDKMKRFTNYARKGTGMSHFALWSDIIFSSMKYNISIMDYFYFRFFEKNEEERKKYAGTGFMYEYQLNMNPRGSRSILADKILFLKGYRKFVRRSFATKKDLVSDRTLVQRFLQNDTGKIVLKGSRGQVGAEVRVVESSNLPGNSLLKLMDENRFDLVEEFVVQHAELMRLSPAGLNTIRIFTNLDNENKLCFLGARLRITVNSYVDNLAAGNIAAPIDMNTGIVNGAAVYSDITKAPVEVHPTTGQKIVGFRIPFWYETLNMIEQAALSFPQNKSIGWDIAVTMDGPELIEGNHNWCKLLWQLPVNQGLKHMIEPSI